METKNPTNGPPQKTLLNQQLANPGGSNLSLNGGSLAFYQCPNQTLTYSVQYQYLLIFH